LILEYWDIIGFKIEHYRLKVWGQEVFNIDKKKCFTKSVSKGSCDTEDWSNDAENAALSHK